MSDWEKDKPTAFQPVYNSSEKLKAKGIDSAGFRKLLKQLFLSTKPEHIDENLSDELRSDFKLMPRFAALYQIHFPENQKSLEAAVFRIKFEELFFVQLRLLRLNKIRTHTVKGFVFSKVGSLSTIFLVRIYLFELTGAQKHIIKEIRADVGSGKQMHGLMQGDVGSGKTLVALMCMLLAIDNGYQTCMMAPTEILAQQR